MEAAGFLPQIKSVNVTQEYIDKHEAHILNFKLEREETTNVEPEVRFALEDSPIPEEVEEGDESVVNGEIAGNPLEGVLNDVQVINHSHSTDFN